MIIKLLILGFFISIWFYRMGRFWQKYEDPDNKAYKERQCAGEEAPSHVWWFLERFTFLAITVVFLRSAPVPHFSYIVFGCVVILGGAVIACCGRSCLGSSWANMGDVTAIRRPLITVGVYRYIRNPIYTGLLLMIIGRAIAIGAFIQDSPLLIMVGLNFLIMLFMYHVEIVAEEKFLLKRYGQVYKDYCQTVGRYVPRVNLSALQQKLSISDQ